jgi:hypothetical protein
MEARRLSEKDDSDSGRLITPPRPRPVRTIARTVAEGIVELVPGGGILTGLVRTAHPPKTELEQEAWQEAVSAKSNAHEDQLQSHETALNPQRHVNGVAAELLAALAKACPDGMRQTLFGAPDLQALVPGSSEQQIADAVYDLEALGLVSVPHAVGAPLRLFLTQFFYEQVDHQVMGWSTQEDAMAIARLMLSADTGDARTLHNETGWGKRRFNPAFAALLPLFPQGHVRQVIAADYPSLGVVVGPEDRAILRRFLSAG